MMVSNTLSVEDQEKRRHPQLAGGCNFRDLGGYPASDGRRVRWQRVYRSGVMDALEDADHVLLAPLGIKTIIDLRTQAERTHRPSRLPKAWSATTWTRDYVSSGGDHTRKRAETTSEEMRATMVKAYRRMPFEQADAYSEMFKRIAAGSVPLLFHCLGGKDRTGVGAALLLDMLGVPREIVVADYVLTERCLARDHKAIAFRDVYANVDQVIREPMMRADPLYLEQMFAKLDEDFGSAQAFVEQKLGVGGQECTLIREQLLE